MNTVKSIIVDIVGDEPISKGAIAVAIDIFRANYIDRPEILLVGIDAHRDLLNLAMPELSMSVTPNTYFGLHIRVDPDLEDNEWRVRKVDTKTYALEN
jgi:hypothetical protein